MGQDGDGGSWAGLAGDGGQLFFLIIKLLFSYGILYWLSGGVASVFPWWYQRG